MDSQFTVKRAWSPKREVECRAVDAFLAELPGGTQVVDVPCSAATRLTLYLNRGVEVIGIDPSAELVAEARRLGMKAEIGDVWDIEAADAVVYGKTISDAEELAEIVSHFAGVPTLIAVRGLESALAELSLAYSLHFGESFNDGAPGKTQFITVC